MFLKISKPVWLFSLLAVCFTLGLGLIPPAVAQTATPTAVVEWFHAALIENMKAGKTRTFEARRARLDPVVRDVFDLATMTRVSTGGAWQKMPEDDRQKLIDTFSAWTVASYAGNFKEWDGESFETKGQTDDGKGNIVVETRLILKGDPPVIFNYRLRQAGGTWRVVDIYLEGAISQIAMHRSEFAAALSAGGVPNLLNHMRDLTAQAMKDGA
jgi:phospholipid transport system substrate-binding protein